MRLASTVSTILVLLFSVQSRADDWPQWLGPQRDSVWRETGIVDRFPDDGLKVKWRAPVNWGYSGPAVVGDRVFLMDYIVREGKITNNAGGPDQLQGTERVICLSADSGDLLWKYEYDRPYKMSYGGGPRCTPAVDSGKVYALGAEGNLSCLDAKTGELVWSKDFVKDYGAETPFWGVAAHPLVDGDTLYCVVGGQGSIAVAFDKNTGRELWRSMSAAAQGYCPPTMIQAGGCKQLLIWHAESINSLDPASGKVYWSIPLKSSYAMSIAAPRKLGDLLFVGGYKDVGVLLKLTSDRPAAEEVWRAQTRMSVYCANSTPFLQDGMVYGCDVDSGLFMGVRLKDGQRVWETFEPTLGKDARRGRYATAFIVKHQDRFLLFNEKGDLIIARLSPEGYEEVDRFHVLEPTNSSMGRPVVWSHPAFANQCLYARNDKEIVCVSLAAE